MLLKGKLARIDKPKKLRYADPYYLDNGKLMRLSENDEEFHKKLLDIVKKN